MAASSAASSSERTGNGKKITSASVGPIMEEPKIDRISQHHRKTRSSRAGSLLGDIEEASKLRGLSSLAVANIISIKVDKRWWRCDWDVHYSVCDGETDSLIFRAVEDIRCCCNGNLQSILIRDHAKNLVARVCYKEKICCSKKLVMAVYAPVDVLVGTVEESTGFIGPTEFVIRNADGKLVFSVEYNNGFCSIGNLLCCCPLAICSCGSYFKVKSTETNSEVGKILEKTSEGLRLQFKTKLDITGKIILTGFCIGLMHKSYHQLSETTNQ